MRHLLLIVAALSLVMSLVLALAIAPAAAQEPPPTPDRPLADAAQEARAQALFNDIRCVVCQHEAISDSPAGIAADMRSLVREEIAAGRSDQQVRDDLVRRYGDFVLFTPPLRGGTWLLWFGPLAVLLVAAAALLFMARRRPVEVTALSAAEEADLARILAEQAVRPDADAKPSDH
jgi:cytochrome c-type biogenesis protein CcmH